MWYTQHMLGHGYAIGLSDIHQWNLPLKVLVCAKREHCEGEEGVSSFPPILLSPVKKARGFLPLFLAPNVFLRAHGARKKGQQTPLLPFPVVKWVGDQKVLLPAPQMFSHSTKQTSFLRQAPLLVCRADSPIAHQWPNMALNHWLTTQCKAKPCNLVTLHVVAAVRAEVKCYCIFIIFDMVPKFTSDLLSLLPISLLPLHDIVWFLYHIPQISFSAWADIAQHLMLTLGRLCRPVRWCWW